MPLIQPLKSGFFLTLANCRRTIPNRKKLLRDLRPMPIALSQLDLPSRSVIASSWREGSENSSSSASLEISYCVHQAKKEMQNHPSVKLSMHPFHGLCGTRSKHCCDCAHSNLCATASSV